MARFVDETLVIMRTLKEGVGGDGLAVVVVLEC